MAEHDVVKPEVLASAAAGLLDREVSIPQTFVKHSVDAFKGADDDTINVKVPGILPAREYGWRNNRSTEMVMDEYAERKIAMSFGGDAYSGVFLTDEQNDFDLISWGPTLEMQARAVGRKLEMGGAKQVKDAPYQVEVGVNAGYIRAGLAEAKRVLDRFNVPGQRYVLVGSDVEMAMLLDPTLTFASVVGDSNADAALRGNVIGDLLGFRLVRSSEVPAGEAYAYIPGAFAFLNAAPYVPQSVPFGATATFNGIALRWIRDYESRKTRDRSIVNTWYGFNHVKDILRGEDWENPGNERISAGEYFVRGVKLFLADPGSTATVPYVYPLAVGTVAETELSKLTDVKSPAVAIRDMVPPTFV